MLKISIIDTPRQRRLVVEGSLLLPWTDQLKTSWLDSRRAAKGRRVVIDFAGVTQISDEALEALSDLIDHGAHFSSGGVLTRHILRHLCRQSKQRKSAKLNSLQRSGIEQEQ